MRYATTRDKKKSGGEDRWAATDAFVSRGRVRFRVRLEQKKKEKNNSSDFHVALESCSPPGHDVDRGPKNTTRHTGVVADGRLVE